jgi:hypothetical protein
LVTKHNGYITVRERNVADCWYLDMFMQNKVQYPWILMKNRTAVCSVCRNVSYLALKNKLAHGWSNTRAGVSGKYSDRLEQLA